MDLVEISPEQARERQGRGAILVDVREPDEHALGVPEGALLVPRARLEQAPADAIASRDSEVLLICAGGGRARSAAQALRDHGYARTFIVIGGYRAWQSAGLPVSLDRDPDFLERYSRQLRLPQVGLEGQERLAKARVLLVGAGGLGSPAAFYLAAAGVGFLRLVDDDVVDRSNLQRQILHTEARVGTAKVESARASLVALNPRVTVEAIPERIGPDNIEALLADIDVVIDGADNFPTRYLLSDACVRMARPLVYGAVHRFEGQVSVFDAGRRRGKSPCYRCLFPEPPGPGEAPNCAEAGVLGVLPGVIGLLQATEAIKLLLGIGEPLLGRLLQFDALSMHFHETRLGPDPDCPACGSNAEFAGYDAIAAWCRGG